MKFKLLRVCFINLLIMVICLVQVAYASNLEDAKQFAATIPILKGKNIEVVPIAGGLTNHIYRITTVQGTNFVLRVFGDEATSLGINPQAQAAIAMQVGNLGVGPKIIYLSQDNKKMLIDFAPGNILSRDTYNQQVCVTLTSKLRKLHEHGNFSTVFDPFSTAIAFRQTALRKAPEIVASFPIADMKRAYLAMQQIQAVMGSHSKKYMRSCHNDLHNKNIFFDADSGILSLLDLDYAGISDLFFDLATFANSLSLNSSETKQLLSSYFEYVTPTIRDEAHLAMMRLVVRYWYSMWFFSQVGSSTIEHNHLQSAKDDLQDFLCQIDTLAFKKWLQILTIDT